METSSENSYGSSDLVSIVIPAYKADKYLPETLASVSNQTFSNWELILVEDGSKGDTEAITRSFANRHPGNRVIYENSGVNRGQAYALNRGIALAKGSFIALIDADDIWLPEHLKTSMDAILAQEADIAFSTSVLFDSCTGNHVGTWGPAPGTMNHIQLGLAQNSFITPSATVLRKCLFERIGSFDESREISSVQDYDFWLRAAIHGAKFIHVDGHHCLYRKGHGEAATTQVELLNFKIAIVLERHISQLQELSVRERDSLLARRLFIAGMHNIMRDSSFAREALKRAWKQERFNPLYAIASLSSFSPNALVAIRRLASPLSASLKTWLTNRTNFER